MTKKIILSLNYQYFHLILSKVFELNYKPDEITIISSENLTNLCNYYKIDFFNIKNNSDFNRFFPDSEYSIIFINVSGLPFLISEQVIKKFSNRIINYHAGLFEKLRGRWPVSWALINNEDTVGYTWHFVNKFFDSGNILYQKEIKIQPIDTAFSLNYKLINHAITKLYYVIKNSNSIGKIPDKLGKYYSKDIPYGGIIQEGWDDQTVDRFTRAMYYPPHKPAVYLKNNVEHKIFSYDDYLKIKNLVE